jgi:hypothetical protein
VPTFQTLRGMLRKDFVLYVKSTGVLLNFELENYIFSFEETPSADSKN